MAYDPLVPTTGQTPAQNYTTIQANFAQIAASYNTDHVDLDGGTPQGYHSKVSFPAGSAPGSAVTSVVLYAKTSNGSSEVFLERDNVGTEIQLTKGIPLSGANTAKSVNNGQTFLPGGFLMKFGTSIENSTSRTIIFTTDANLTAFNSIYQVFLYPLGTGKSSAVTSISNTQIVFQSGDVPTTIYWVAIGT